MTLPQAQSVKALLVGLVLILAGCGATTQEKPVVSADPEPVDSQEAGQPPVEAPIDPQIAESFNRGLTAITDGDVKMAENIFFAMTKAYPEMPGPFANLGMLLAQRGEYEQAEAALRQALILKPDMPEVYNHLGMLYRGTGRFKEALEIYQQGLKIAPEHTNLLRNAGILMDIYLDMPQQALEHYRRYLELMPDDKEVEIWIAGLTQRVAN